MTNLELIQRRFRPRLPGIALALFGLLAATGISRGQEALRLSMTGDLAAAVRHEYITSIGYYNLLLGPSAWSFTGGLGAEYNDNVRLQESGESDLILRPNVNVQMHWPVSLKNSFDISMGVGYSEYIQHPDLSQFYITPLSGLSFDVYLGDFKINLHDQVNISEYAYQNPGNGGNQDLVSLQNTVGANVLWDMDKIVANVGYDHANYLSLSQNQGEPDVSSENFFANAGIRIWPELLVGLEAGGSLIDNSQSTVANTPASNASQWNVGAFATAQISEYIKVRLDGGYTVYTPDNTATNLLTSGTSGFYFSLSLTHIVNRMLSYTLSAGHSTDLSAYGQAQNYYFVRLEPTLNLFKKYSIGPQFWWQQANEIYGSTASGVGSYRQIGIGVHASHNFNTKLSGTIYYQFVKDTGSNLSNANYLENIVGLNFNYRF